MTHTARITEVFSSLQGEGPHTGQPTTFVRLALCHMGCTWCDTAYALCDHDKCRVADAADGSIKEISNPVTATALSELVSAYSNRMLSVTGGEPLEQVAFLEGWLPSIQHKYTVLLETNGVMWEELKRVVDYVHIVSMDLKLPSSAGCRPMWKEHDAFLRTAVAAGREVCVKIVVTGKTTDKDVQDSIKLITKVNKYINVVVQPANPTATFHDVVSRQRLASIDRICRAYLPNVLIGRQMHKEWNIQ